MQLCKTEMIESTALPQQPHKWGIIGTVCSQIHFLTRPKNLLIRYTGYPKIVVACLWGSFREGVVKILSVLTQLHKSGVSKESVRP